MKSKLMIAIILIVVSIMAVTMVSSAKGTGKEITNKDNKEFTSTFNGEENSAYKLNEGETIGTQFSIAADATFVGIGCPSWSDDIGELTLKMYKFDKDYETTVKGTPIAEHTFKDYQDNSFLGFEYTAADPLKAGEYLIVISDALDEGGSGVGIWSHKKYEGQNFYEEGVYNKSLSARMHVVFKGEAPATPYGTLTPAKEDNGNVNTDPNPFLGAVMRFTDPAADTYYTMNGALYIDEIEIKDGKLVVPVTAGNDPQFYMDIQTSLTPPSCEEYPIMLIRMKRAEGSPKAGEIYFNTSDFAGPTAGGSVTFAYADTTEWQDVIVDFSSNKNYTGDLLTFRFDIVQSSEGEFEYQIDYILFFGTEEAAKNFTDINSLPTPSPTPEPTPTPEKTATPVKTEAAPTATPVKEKEGGINPAVIVGIVAAVVVVAAVAVIIIKKKKA